MKINYELLFFIIKSRLFHSSVFFPSSVCGRRGLSIPFTFGAGRLCLCSPWLPVPLPDQHPFAASSACPLLGLEISHSSLLNYCRISLHYGAMSERTSAFCQESTREPSAALHGCTGRLRVQWQVSSLVL